MRKRKLQGGKQDIAGTKEEDPRTKDWIVELNAASRALALRWLRAAREGLDGELAFNTMIPASRIFPTPRSYMKIDCPFRYLSGSSFTPGRNSILLYGSGEVWLRGRFERNSNGGF